MHAVSGFLLQRGSNILDSSQYADAPTGAIAMRIHFEAQPTESLTQLNEDFAPIANQFALQRMFYDLAAKPRVLLMASRHDHCLNDLLYRFGTDGLQMEIPAVVSNHRDIYRLVASHDIPFEQIPVTADNKTYCDLIVLDDLSGH